MYTYPLPQKTPFHTRLDYLENFIEHRQRLNRNKEYGKGIISGLELEIGANHAITITDGFGFTSQGLPIEQYKTVYTHFTPHSPPPFPFEMSSFLQLDAKSERNFHQSKGIFKLIKEDEANKDNDLHLKIKEDLSEFVVTLFLEASVKKSSKDNKESSLELKVVPSWFLKKILLLRKSCRACTFSKRH